MTRDDDFIGQVQGYLDEYEGLTPLPDAVRDAIRAELPTTRQIGPLPGPMRFLNMTMGVPTAARYGLVAAAVLAAVLVGSALFGRGPNAGGGPEPTPIPTPSLLVVRATANIFGAGQERAPDPGGGGGGTLPPEWPVPGEATTVTFPSVAGEVNAIYEVFDYNGPGGDMASDTDVASFGGISGIIHHANGMFLVGVFLTDDPPTDPAPARLDFTDNEDFDVLEPEIGQTFFIGDGVGHRYVVSPGATRLFLGFVNAYIPGDPHLLTHGEPGYYGNNAGELEVIIDVASE